VCGQVDRRYIILSDIRLPNILLCDINNDIKTMCEESSSLIINWQAIAAVATFIAVVVALIPIWREAYRTKAKARSLRFRLSSKLIILRPSFHSIIRKGKDPHSAAVLSPDYFQKIIQSIANMMKETSVLNTDEQDQLGVTFANLEIMSILYGTDELDADGAENAVKLIDRTIAIMGEHGYLTGNVIKPWDSNSTTT